MAREGGGEEVVRAAADIHVVRDDRAGEDEEPDHLLVYDSGRRHGGGAKRRQLSLSVGVDADGQDAPDVDVESLCRLGGEHYLVGAIRVGHAALRHRHPVLVEVQVVHAPVAVARGGRIEVRGVQRSAVAVQGEEVDPGLALHLFHVRQPGDLPDQRRVVSGIQADRRVEHSGRPDQVGEVAAGEVDRRGRGGAPCSRDRAQRQAADEPDQHDNREVAAPSVGELRPKAVPGKVHHRPREPPEKRPIARKLSHTRRPGATVRARHATVVLALLPFPLR